ncbi:MAG: hypothetical protein HYY13_00815 [Nitrospirae bacterium]|nr:hypothetical protein [Nitrospirota bacterium]
MALLIGFQGSMGTEEVLAESGKRPARAPTAIRASSDGNPFGVMLPRKHAEVARQLGVRFYRPNAVFVDQWNGKSGECELAHAQGLDLVLTIRNDGGRKPTSPPKDLDRFRRVVAEILAACRPVLLVVENEENSEALFYTGTPEEYHRELSAACAAAHERGIPCTNGGLVSNLVLFLLAEDLEMRGQKDEAGRVMDEGLGKKALEKLGKGKIHGTALLRTERAHQQLTKGRALLAGYRDAGADYVNFHWYVPRPEWMAQAVAYLTRVTGLPALTNEMGRQLSEDPAEVRALMKQVLDLKLPLAVWFSIDVPGFGGARALVAEDGALRANGRAFKEFLAERFERPGQSAEP